MMGLRRLNFDIDADAIDQLEARKLTRYFYELRVKNGQSHPKGGQYYTFISGQNWAKVDFTGSYLRIASSSLDLDNFVTWVSNETKIPEKDILAEQITGSSSNHDGYREVIQKYYKVTL
ncbi:hypothetical protein [Agrobacterium sp. Azo12]|uniref:hypothetical protein n=1 Tax=Agrobacterium sp. Azo12 TaxID=3031129 RepID=UPI0023D8A58F|nr:hypothetical protein [Agrobacterium sp. Azo12]MDO5895139.1 hypothetical protein [Agrobacterium sp. Azo12]